MSTKRPAEFRRQLARCNLSPTAWPLARLAIYLLLVGLINLRRRPLVVSGSRELAALGVAMVGLLIVGPMQLFVPDATALRFGWLVWPLLLSSMGCRSRFGCWLLGRGW